MDYPIPKGVHAIPHEKLDLRSNSEIDHVLLHPPAVRNEKNIWFYWHTGYPTMHGYLKRNVRTWHRRFSKQGWVIRVLDREPGSPLNVSHYLGVTDPETFPRAFIDRTLAGRYAVQHNSDLVRWPLLLKYGGIYADVGMIQIGDVDRLWNETLGDPGTPFEVLSYAAGGVQGKTLTNYFLASHKNNPLFERCHRLLLALWAEDGGKTTTDGMHASLLLKGVPMMSGAGLAFEENGRKYSDEETGAMLTDYIIQGQVSLHRRSQRYPNRQLQATTMAMGLIDEEDNWNGPEYVAKHVWATDFTVGSQLINEYTAWNGTRAFELMSLPLPKEGETESTDQNLAREIVENCLSRSFGFKLATGLILRVMGETLSSLWKKHDGSDDVPGTYAHWLRHGTLYWCEDELPPRTEAGVTRPWKRGPLLRNA